MCVFRSRAALPACVHQLPVGVPGVCTAPEETHRAGRIPLLDGRGQHTRGGGPVRKDIRGHQQGQGEDSSPLNSKCKLWIGQAHLLT